MNTEVRPDVPLGRRSPTAKCRVVVADRSVISRVGIRAILERTPGTAVIAEATSYDAVLDSVDEHGPDILVIDLDLGDDTTRGLKLCETVSERYPETKVLVLSSTLSEVVVVEALRRGANGFLCKEELMADELSRGVRQIQEGETVLGKGVANLVARGLGSTRSSSERFTDRELSVIQKVAEGLSNKQIANQLFVTESTVKFHLQNISKKLGAHRKAEIVHKATAAGLL